MSVLGPSSLQEKDLFSYYSVSFNTATFSESSINYDEEVHSIIINNNYYEISFNKENGAILYIKDKTKNRDICRGTINSSLWRLIFKNNKELESNLYSFNDKNNIFQYQWIKEKSTLELYYKNQETKALVSVYFYFKRNNIFDAQMEISNHFSNIIINSVMPQGFSFDIDNIKKFYFPWKMGIFFNKNFFTSKRFISEPYPFLFADFISLDSQDGNLSIYMIQNKDEFQQVKLNVGYNSYLNGVGIYEHVSAVYIENNQLWKSPILRFSVGSPVMDDLKGYVKANELDKSKSLKEKIGEKLFKQLSEGVLLKIDFHWVGQPFYKVAKFVSTLPKSTIIHMLSFWPEGFDKHYPDYIPPDKKLGTTEDLKNFVKTARQNGLLLMPYTNPTWWNEGPTLRRLKRENIGVRKLDGTIHDEAYWFGQNKGVIVSPNHPDVINRINQTADQFSKEIKMDMLFEDQLGARPWIYDLNLKANQPVGYTRGIINIAERDSQKLPIMTEGGFDQLIPDITGFCDMSVNSALPPDPIYNRWWGRGTWEIEPIMLSFLRSKVAIYQHNLAHEVFTDSKEKLTWNLAFGHNLFIFWWPPNWYQLKQWFLIADAFQKNVVSRYFGKNLTEFKRLEPQVTWSRFEDMGILANHNLEKTFKFGNHTIAKGGFLAQTENHDLLAGLFTSYNNRLLNDECYIIEKRENETITIEQPSPNSTFISVLRPKEWKNPQWIQCVRENKSIPVAVNSKTITFLYEKEGDENKYSISYQKPKMEEAIMAIQTGKEEVVNTETVKVKLLVQNNSTHNFSKAQFVLSVLTLNQGIGELEEKKGNDIVKEIGDLTAGHQMDADFVFTVPHNVKTGDVIWLKGVLTYQVNNQKKEIVIRRDMVVSESLQIVLSKQNLIISPGDKEVFEIKIKNISDRGINGKFVLDITDLPPSWIKNEMIPFSLNPDSEKKVEYTINVSPQPIRRKGLIVPKIIMDNMTNKSTLLSVDIIPPLKQIELTPNILMFNKKQKITVKVAAQPDFDFSGSLEFNVPSSWKLDKSKIDVELIKGENKSYEIIVIPQTKDKAEFTLLNKDNSKYKFMQTIPVIKDDEVSLVESDLNGDGYTEIALGNNKIELLLTTIIGGRILTFYNRVTGNNQLFTDYPGIEMTKTSSQDDWAEYGGINDCLPVAWPGDIWNNEWEYYVTKRDPKQVSVMMKTETQNQLLLQRTITMNSESSKVNVDYIIKNNSVKDVKFVWANHPDLAPGPEKDGKVEVHKIIIPTGNKIMERSFGREKVKNTYLPNDNWCVAFDSKSGEYFGQLFDKSFIKEIGVWEGVIFYTMELISKEVSLSPGESKKFSLKYFTGINDWKEQIKK